MSDRGCWCRECVLDRIVVGLLVVIMTFAVVAMFAALAQAVLAVRAS